MSSKDSGVFIQTSAQSVPSTPSWFGEVAVTAYYLRHVGVLATIEERVRFARRRFGHYDLIDFVVVLLGYAISGEHTLEAFYERLHPFAAPFMALFGRERLPHRSTLSRFLAALGQAAVEVLRTVFLEDLVARPLEKEEKTGGLWDRQGNHWLIFDVDGTRQTARQRALPSTPDLPPLPRRLDEVCAPGYTGRKRGGNCPHQDHRTPGPYAPMGRHVFGDIDSLATAITEVICDKRKARSARICRHNPFP